MAGGTAPAGTFTTTSGEAELVSRAKARSPQAWTEIYTTHYPAIFRYVKGRVFDQATAEDLASEVFLRALKAISSYQYRGRPLLAWLYRIASNTVASHQRQLLGSWGRGFKEGLNMPRRAIRLLMGQAPAGDSELLAAPGGPDDPATTVDRLDLRDALAKLTAAQREVVILRFKVGLSTAEVADVMGKKPAAIYSLQARALLALREQLR